MACLLHIAAAESVRGNQLQIYLIDEKLGEVPVNFTRDFAQEIIIDAIVRHAALGGGGQASGNGRVRAALKASVARAVRDARLAQDRHIVHRHLSKDRVRLGRGGLVLGVRIDLEVGGGLLQSELIAWEA